MSNVKADFVVPIVVLTVICLVSSAALAVTNDITAPIISQAEQEAAEQARLEVLPDASGFTLVELSSPLDGVDEVYKADNDVGFAITVTQRGYNGDITAAIGIDNSGHIVRVKVISHEETPSVGSKVMEDSYLDTLIGKDSSLEGVSAIAGATVSSNALKSMVQTAFATYEIVSEGVSE